MTTSQYSGRNRWAALALVSAVAILPARAVVLFDAGIPPGAVSDIGYSDVGNNYRPADHFSFSSPVILNKINFLGGYYPDNSPLSDAFTLTIYNDDPVHNTPNSASIVAQINLGNPGRVNTGASY